MASDSVNHPDHYNQHPSGIECVTIASGFDYCLGNCIKYIWRAGLKNKDPLEDLRKAVWYLNYKIKQLEERRGQCTVTGNRPSTGGEDSSGTGVCVPRIVRIPAGADCYDPCEQGTASER